MLSSGSRTTGEPEDYKMRATDASSVLLRCTSTFRRPCLRCRLVPAGSTVQLVIAFLCLAVGLSVRAAPQPDGQSGSFDAANRLFEQGKFSEAISSYQALLEHPQRSAALYFNLGNAYFRNGQIGQAIASYRLAERLAPRDPDVRANLRFARESIGAEPPPFSRWDRWLRLLTLNQQTYVTASFFWACLLLLAGRQLWPEQRVFRTAASFCGVATTILATWLAVSVQRQIRTTTAVVIAKDSAIRYGPFEESQSFSKLHDGTELAVLNRKENWLQVRDATMRTGWVQDKDLLLLPPG